MCFPQIFNFCSQEVILQKSQTSASSKGNFEVKFCRTTVNSISANQSVKEQVILGTV